MRSIFGLFLILLTVACTQTNTPIAITTITTEPIYSTPTQQETADHTTRLPSATTTFTPNPPSPVPATNTPELTSTLAPSSSTPIASSGQIVVDHTSLVLFDKIPDEFIKKASDLRMLYRHASVGDNMRLGLLCLWGNFPDRRPSHCLPFHDLKYDPSNWDFQARGNPGWIAKVDDFIEQSLLNGENYDILTFTLGYVDGLDNAGYPEISDPENFENDFIGKLEALEDEYPDKIFIWWTMPLARVGYANTQRFNNMLREYAFSHNKILLDIADIESHDPDGVLQTSPEGYPVIYQGYTKEIQAGHLDDVARDIMARAIWVMMARIAGWDGN